MLLWTWSDQRPGTHDLAATLLRDDDPNSDRCPWLGGVAEEVALGHIDCGAGNEGRPTAGRHLSVVARRLDGSPSTQQAFHPAWPGLARPST